MNKKNDSAEDSNYVPSGLESLKFIMEENDMSETDLAKLLGCHQSVASHILSGKRKLKLNELKILSKRFCLSVDYFI